jgi:hypothetical protein
MSDEFRRLLDDSANSPLHAVLEAGLRDRPSPRHLARAALALGVGAAGLGAAQSAAAAETARALGASVWAGLARWGAAGLLIGGAALSPLVLHAPPEAPLKAGQRGPQYALLAAQAAAPTVRRSAPPGPQTQPPEIAAARATPSPRIAPLVPEAGPTPALVAEPPVASFQPLTEAPAPPVNSARASNLDTEVALLDAARSALKQNDPSTALSWLDRHARLSTPSLAAEASLVRVQALVAAGRVPEAQAVARRAIGSANRSTYALRLGKLAGLTVRQ